MPAITVTVLGTDEAIKRFATRRDAVSNAVFRQMLVEMQKTAEYIRASKLSGQVLKNRTGTLRRSIHANASRTGNLIAGMVGTNVEYARYQELGTKAHVILPVRAKALAFKTATGETVFARRVNHPGFPPHPFLRPGVQERRAAILDGLHAAVVRALNE